MLASVILLMLAFVAFVILPIIVGCVEFYLANKNLKYGLIFAFGTLAVSVAPFGPFYSLHLSLVAFVVYLCVRSIKRKPKEIQV